MINLAVLKFGEIITKLKLVKRFKKVKNYYWKIIKIKPKLLKMLTF